MSLTYVDYGDRFAVANDDGSHVVWKQITRDGAGNVVGPGYLGRVIFRAADGTITGPCSVALDPSRAFEPAPPPPPGQPTPPRARLSEPGKSWTNYFSVSRNAGWVI